MDVKLHPYQLKGGFLNTPFKKQKYMCFSKYILWYDRVLKYTLTFQEVDFKIHLLGNKSDVFQNPPFGMVRVFFEIHPELNLM